MSKLQFQYDIQNLTPANAQPVEANFTRVEDHVNQEIIERDGTVAMRAQLKLVGDPVAALDAAPKQYVDQVLPIGLVMMYGGSAVPTNGRWLLCDGSVYQTATYPELFAVVGYSFGGSGGSFNVPNLSDRLPMGQGTKALGTQGGSADSSLPAHDHPIPHDHGKVLAETQEHTHLTPDHLHTAGSLGAQAVPDHTHTNQDGTAFVGNAGNTPLQFVGSSIIMVDYRVNTGPGGGHGHPIVGNTGASDRPLTTSGRSAVHDHVVPATPDTVKSVSTGVAPTGTNLPPYLAIAFVIRCK